MEINELRALVSRFGDNLSFYKRTGNYYNEHSCRIEYIDPFLEMLGWDVANRKGLAPQFREVIAENYSTSTDRPDYSLTLRGVTKLFVEAKKPAVDISRDNKPAIQARKYGWNAGHKVAILTNFEYFVIYDCTFVPEENDPATTARYRIYHYTEYEEKFDEIAGLVSRDAVYSGYFDSYFDDQFPDGRNKKQQVDDLFLSQINEWRVSLSNELYSAGGRYRSLDVLNDVVQEFINQIVFLRICEDRNLPVYHSLQETVADEVELNNRLEQLFREADRRYNSGMFSGEYIVFDLDSLTIKSMIEGLYYPKSPYLFNIIEPNMLGKIYEAFLTEQLLEEDDHIILGKKKDCMNRSVVTTPVEIVKYMVERTLEPLCMGKTPDEIRTLRLADIACGSGIYLEAIFDYIQSYCVSWYLENDKDHLEEIGNGRYKLPLAEKKSLMTSCVYGIDIDIHAVEVAKFSLEIKLIEDETAPSVAAELPILPDLSTNIFYGNALVGRDELIGINVPAEQMLELVPFDWTELGCDEGFDAIIGNPPYVNTEGIHALLPTSEFEIYKKKYKSSHKQFDKYFIFVERAINKVKTNGYVCYIIPNKFFKVGAGEKLRSIIASKKMLVSLDDFGDAQLFADKTIYSSIVLVQKKEHDTFIYRSIDTAGNLWAGEDVSAIELESSILNKLPWRLTTDFDFLEMLNRLDQVSVPLTKHVDIFNGIQTSAERPNPIYWFSGDQIVSETVTDFEIEKDGNRYRIEKEILRPYFKPTRQSEKGLNSYSLLGTDKRIIFPYDQNGRLIPREEMIERFPGTWEYLKAYYERLVPKTVSEDGIRDVPNATAETWYQYGRTQALTSFINTPKLIVGVLSKEPMYAYDTDDMLIASGGTAGYVAISKKPESPYALEYIQAWLSNEYTEKILDIVGSDFEGGFISRGSFVLSTLPFVELDLENERQKQMYDRVVHYSREVYRINQQLASKPSKRVEQSLLRQKSQYIDDVQDTISKVYRLEF